MNIFILYIDSKLALYTLTKTKPLLIVYKISSYLTELQNFIH